MAKSPFRVNAPASVNVNAGTQRTSPPKAKVFEHAVGEGEELYEAAVEESAPDHEVGAGAPTEAGINRGEDHVQQPAYPPAIPWPQPALGVAHMPMKLKP